MTWWRELGEGFGFPGSFQPESIGCAYCGCEGAFTQVFEESRNLKRWHVLHYVALRCNQCSNITFIIWGRGERLWNYKQFPAPVSIKAPDHWPQQIGNAYVQAEKSLDSESWDAAATMARRAVQATIRQMLGKSQGMLRNEIKELVEKQILPKTMGEWADEVRELGNVAAHPEETHVLPDDAKAIVRFTRYFIQYAIDIPQEIDRYRKPKS